MSRKDYYSILGVEPSATKAEIKSAYRKLALKYHPDHNANSKTAAAQFKRVQEAYEFLSDTAQRKEYNKNYRRKAKVKKKTRKTTAPPKKGQDLRYNIYITLEESFTGCNKVIRYLRNTGGVKETIQLNVVVPPGTRNMQRLRVTKYGNEHAGSFGNLFVVVHVEKHPFFEVDGPNLKAKLPITYIQALVGGPIVVPTLQGVAEITLNPCSFHNKVHRLVYKGLPDPKTGKRGHLLIEFVIDSPTKISPREINALRKMIDSWPKSQKMKEYEKYIQSKS